MDYSKLEFRISVRLGGDWSEATGVSADGSIIVGWSYDANGIYRAFKSIDATGMQDLGAGDYSKAFGVSSDWFSNYS